jgi:hypothetical protein
MGLTKLGSRRVAFRDGLGRLLAMFLEEMRSTGEEKEKCR